MSERKNLIKGTLSFTIVGILILFGLRFLAGEMGAGSAGFNLSTPFLVMQAIVIISSYVFWYRRVNRRAADMMSISEMRKMAFDCMGLYMIRSIIITLVIGLAALVVMVLDLLSIGIPAIYSYSSVCSMFFIGNIALYLMMRFALPNRVTGSY